MGFIHVFLVFKTVFHGSCEGFIQAGRDLSSSAKSLPAIVQGLVWSVRL